MDEVSRLYRAQERSKRTHLTLRWKGKVRYTVPRDSAAQQVCWRVFRPGKLGVPLRAMAQLPRVFGATECIEGAEIISIRQAIGEDAGPSCCRAGSEGSWSKNTVLFVDKAVAKPLYIVKTGAGVAIDGLLKNEAQWLRNLEDQASLAIHIPELVAHRPGADFCFVVQTVVSGKFDMRLGELHFDFLRKLQKSSLQTINYQESGIYRTLNSRLAGLSDFLPDVWSARLEKAVRRIGEILSVSPVLVVTAHNDFTPWNVGLKHDLAHVFDWEFAADEQLPLFDPLHFALMPLGLWGRPVNKILRAMKETVQQCQIRLGAGFCYEAQTQALAYLVNVCTLYLCSLREESFSHPLIQSYAQVIDHLCGI